MREIKKTIFAERGTNYSDSIFFIIKLKYYKSGPENQREPSTNLNYNYEIIAFKFSR